MNIGRIVAAVIVVAILVIVFLLRLEQIINVIQERLTAFREGSRPEEKSKSYRDDKYGGKTPEETFNLFITALKKEDVNLASKYFIFSKQEGWRKVLEEYKTQGLIRNFIDELENIQLEWQRGKTRDPNIAEFSISSRNEPSSSETTTFERYPNGVWKINLL